MRGLMTVKTYQPESREGWELVRGEEYPDFDIPTIQDGQHAGIIGVGGLLLARIPLEIVEERNDYFRGYDPPTNDGC